MHGVEICKMPAQNEVEFYAFIPLISSHLTEFHVQKTATEMGRKPEKASADTHHFCSWWQPYRLDREKNNAFSGYQKYGLIYTRLPDYHHAYLAGDGDTGQYTNGAVPFFHYLPRPFIQAYYRKQTKACRQCLILTLPTLPCLHQAPAAMHKRSLTISETAGWPK
jgi:hypothetical protein